MTNIRDVPDFYFQNKAKPDFSPQI